MLLRLAIWCVCGLLAMAALSAVYWRADPPTDVAWAASLISTKKAKLELLPPGPRIILAGGSSVHFGYSAELLSAGSGRNVFNAGSHASLGPRFHAHNAMQLARPGDTVILIVEHENYYVGSYPNQFLKDYTRVFDQSFQLDFDRYFSPTLWSYLRNQLVWHLHQALVPIAAPPAAMAAPAQQAAVSYSDPYDLSFVNAWGDQAQNKAQLLAPWRLVSPYLPPAPIKPLDESLFAFLARVKETAAAANIELIIGWPPYMDRPALHESGFTSLFREISDRHARNGVATLGRPEEFLMPHAMFLDTQYHPNEVGMTEASKTLLVHLRQHLD